ncbi:hypothetical protein EON68_00600, partial [archaeon]
MPHRLTSSARGANDEFPHRAAADTLLAPRPASRSHTAQPPHPSRAGELPHDSSDAGRAGGGDHNPKVADADADDAAFAPPAATPVAAARGDATSATPLAASHRMPVGVTHMDDVVEETAAHESARRRMPVPLAADTCST